MLTVGVLVFYWGQDRKYTESRFQALEKRLDAASERSSKLTGMVQSLIGRMDRLPEELREKFCSHDSAELLIDKAIRERQSGV